MTNETLLHRGVDLCEVAAAIEVIRALEIVRAVNGIVSGFSEGAFRAGFETACEEIAHRLEIAHGLRGESNDDPGPCPEMTPIVRQYSPAADACTAAALTKNHAG